MKHVLLIILITLLSSISIYAEDLNKRAEALVNKTISKDSEGNIKYNISPEMQKSVESIYNSIIGNGRLQEEVSSLQKRIDIDEKTGIITFKKDGSSDNKSVIKQVNSVFDNTDRLYIFVSSSLPDYVIKNYRDYVKAKGIEKSVYFVIRGCVPGGGFNGCKDFNPTINFAKKFIITDDNKTVSSMLIDPVLFKRYNVTEVPQVVYATNVIRSVDLGSEGDYKRLEREPDYWKSIGDWSLDYHIQELYNKSNSKKLKQLVVVLN